MFSFLIVILGIHCKVGSKLEVSKRVRREGQKLKM